MPIGPPRVKTSRTWPILNLQSMVDQHREWVLLRSRKMSKDASSSQEKGRARCPAGLGDIDSESQICNGLPEPLLASAANI